MNLRHHVLQALSTTPAYGLQIINWVNTAAGKILLHQGNAYPLLRELEREGLLESWDGETTPERGNRPRRYYRLTLSGRQVLDKSSTDNAYTNTNSQALHPSLLLPWPTG